MSISKPRKTSQTTLPYLDKLKLQKEKLEARIQAAEARNKVTERKRDVRRKILVGSYYLDKIKKIEDEHVQAQQMQLLTEALDTFLTRDSDRVLFGLTVSGKVNTTHET